MIEHGGEMTIGITTPVGTSFRATTTFIGKHSENVALIELPKINDDDLEYFFQEGFWLVVRAISQRGEGALVHFRSQIVHLYQHPIPMVAISVPQTMEVAQLRKEPRYELNLAARICAEERRVECEIRDLSKGGCRFVTTPLARNFQIGDSIRLEVVMRSRHDANLAPLYGKVCNLQRSLHYAKYGVEFDELGQDAAKKLLSHLKFDGTKLTLRVLNNAL